MEQLFDRAMVLLSFMSEETAIDHLVKQGVPKENAFLAVKAAKILLEDA